MSKKTEEERTKSRDATKTYTNDDLVVNKANRPEEAPQSASSVDSLQSTYVESRRAMLYSENFDKLDAEADVLLASKARFPGGDWKLPRFFNAIEEPVGGYDVLIDRSSSSDEGNGASAHPEKSASESAWLRHLSVLRRWRSARPESSIAVLALAKALTNYAWRARGTGYANTVTDEQARIFHERLGQAERLISEYRPNGPRNPEFFCLMITFAMAEGREAKDVQKLVAEAMTIEPLYLNVYSNAAYALMPRWLGQPGEWEHFADDVSQRVGGREGSVVYGHIMWHLEPFYGSGAFFDEHAALWPRIKQAFVDREAIYGSSPELLNAFALLAVGVRDKPTAHDVFARLGDKWDLTVWQKRHVFDSNRKWAGSE